MKRAKEINNSSIAYANIRYLGGFICIDTHLGCKPACNYCLNRRDKKLDEILNKNIEFNYTDIISVKEIYEILKQSPSYKAKIPLRIGHLTDFIFEEKETFELLNLIDKNYPVVLMTKFPISDYTNNNINKYPNVIIHISIAPKIKGAEKYYISPEKIIDSAKNINKNNLLYMIRPLSFGVFDEVISVFNYLPENSNISLKELSTDNIDSAADLKTMSKDDIIKLKHIAEKKHIVFDMFGCLLRKNLKIPFFKFEETNKINPNFCFKCSNFEICKNKNNFFDIEKLKELLKIMNIDFLSVETKDDSVQISTNTLTSRADEIYFSEYFNKDIKFSSVLRLEKSSVTDMDNGVLERWKKTNFYPVDKMIDITKKIEETLKMS